MDWSKVVRQAVFSALVICAVGRSQVTPAQGAAVESTALDAADSDRSGSALTIGSDSLGPRMRRSVGSESGRGDEPECATDADCDDGLNCTIDTCDPNQRCVHQIKSTYCAIGGACYKDLYDNPLNECQYCDVFRDREHWTPRPAGTPCGDPTENPCTFADSCNASGGCLDNNVEDGTPCPNGVFCDGAEVCAGGVCQSGDPACDRPGLICDEAYETCTCQSGVNCAVLHVDLDAPGPTADGLSWDTAYRDLQDALDHAAGSAGAVTQIHVAQGTYEPSKPADLDDPRTASFQLVNGIRLEGGYAGFGVEDPDSRSTSFFQSTLSGDLNGDDVGGWDDPGRGENAYRVVTGIACGEKTIIDGFTITAGHAEGPGGFNAGGGLYALECSAIVANCTFADNWAVLGGGMFNFGESTPTVINSIFRDNAASFQGGGMWNGLSQPTVINSVFRSNSAYTGGGMSNNASFPMLINCTFAGNTAENDGGGMANVAGSPTLSGCILWDNHDSSGNGQSAQIDGPAAVTYSNVGGSWPGIGNINADPMFADEDLRLSPGSPCIDAGNNDALPGDITLDLEGRRRYIDHPDTPDTGNGSPPVIDMGAYEFRSPGEVRTHLDILPGECPNVVGRREPRLLRMALVGTDTFAPNLVDLGSLVLSRADGLGGTITPLMEPPEVAPRLYDTATAFEGVQCGCHAREGDGRDDLVITLITGKVAVALDFDTGTSGSPVSLTLSGSLVDGARFEAGDCVLLVRPDSPPPFHRRKGPARSR